jgi:outer membrane protein TolC
MRKTSSRILIVLWMLFACTCCRAEDTIATLSKDAFISVLRKYHPVLRQADLLVERTKAEILQARGAFDPKVDAGLDRKTFDNKLYYSYFNPQLTIPTWYGVDVKAGVEEIIGDRVTPEATLGRTSYLGVRIPANNLLFDSRRAVLRQAQSIRKVSEAERALIINDLFFNAMKSYWNWVGEYQQYRLISEVVRVNEERLKFVILEYEQGSRPAIDTIEALTQLQGFYLQQSDAWLSFQNAGLELSNYLWQEEDRPFEWSTSILPPESALGNHPEIPGLEQLIQHAAVNHPKLLATRYKGDVLETEQRLKAQYLLPKLNLNANLLSKGYDLPNELTMPFLENNYKFGFDFSIPLFLREARGAYQAARIKRQENVLEQQWLALQVQNDVKSYYNEVVQLHRQLKTFEQALANSIKLFQGERIRFEVGESTLFVLNSRENKVLETSQKLTELRAKLQKSHVGLLWAAGVLTE